MPKSRMQLFLQQDVQSRALKTSLLVGSILGAINYGDVLLAGDMTADRWLKLVVTYLVPYAVSSWSSIQALKAN